MKINSRRRGWWAFAFVAMAVACSSSSSSPPSTAGVVAEQTIGPAGGTVTSADGTLKVAVPAGALGSDLKITVEEIASPAPGAVGKTYEIGPTGTQFKTPVTLSLKYVASDLGGHAASELEVSTIVDGAWAPLAGDSVDAAAEVASGTTMHLSPYALVFHGSGNGKKDAGSDAAEGTDGSALDAGASDGAVADAATEAGTTNGSCGATHFSASDAGAGNCTVTRPDGTATLLMVCTPSTCHCYVNDTSAPYGNAFSSGTADCATPQLALQQMLAFCGCP